MWASVVGPGDENLDVELPGGQRLARCLRCDCWVPHEAPNAGIEAGKVLRAVRHGGPVAGQQENDD